MKVSLITSTYNSAHTLQDTLDSVRSQSYPNIEYIVIDGASTDQTLDILKANDDIIDQLVSEPDKGIYDALNKGIQAATGDVVGLLHSDDVFSSTDVISSVVATFEANDTDAVYGDLEYVKRTDLKKRIRFWQSKPFNRAAFLNGWMPAHPTFYLKRKYYEQYGGFDDRFYTSADYELMLRMLFKHELNATYLSKTMVSMRVGGQSNVSWKNRWIANREDAKAWKVNGLRPRIYTRWMKPLSKLLQFAG